MSMEGSLFGGELTRRREALGLDEAGVAALAGLQPETLRWLEDGTLRPSRQLAEILADKLAVPVAERGLFVARVRSIGTLGAPPASPADVTPDESAYTNLPLHRITLVGRVDEVDTLGAMLRRKDMRLLTLVGPGGVGKSRLAIAVADSLLPEFPEGVFYVPLRLLSDPALVIPALARALMVATTSADALENIARALVGKKVLLLLDGFDGVAAAAAQLGELLAAAPRLKVLVTARRPLHIDHEYAFPVLPLATPDPALYSGALDAQALATIGRNPAVELFMRRASTAAPDFQLAEDNAAAVAAVCVRLDGLPLMLDLAAGQLVSLSPQQLLDGIAALPQRTAATSDAEDDYARMIAALIGWSDSLLTEQEKRVFYRMAVLSGVTMADSVVAVQASGATVPEVTETLLALAGRALVWRGLFENGRSGFGLLAAPRRFALTRLQASGAEDAARLALAEYYARLVGEFAPLLRSASRYDSLFRLQIEYDNLRAMLGWSLTQPETAAVGLRIAAALPLFWYFRGYAAEGVAVLEHALALAPETGGATLAEAQSGAGLLLLLNGAAMAALPYLEAAVALFRALGDRRGIAYVLAYLGAVRSELDDEAGALAAADESVTLLREAGTGWDVALALFFRVAAGRETDSPDAAESAALFRSLGDPWGVGLMQLTSSWLAGRRSDINSVGDLLREAQAHFGAARDLYGVVSTMLALAENERHLGVYEKATAYYEESLALSRQADYKPVVSRVLHTLGYMAIVAGHYEKARLLCEESLTIAAAEGHQETAGWALRNLAYVTLLEGDKRGAFDLYARAATLFGSLGARMGQALLLADLISARDIAAAPEQAARLIGATDAMMGFYRVHFDEADRLNYDRLVAQVRSALPDESFAANHAAGISLPIDEAIALATAE